MTALAVPASPYTDRTAFTAALVPPAAGGSVRVYSGHQLQTDYAASVTAKLRALGEVPDAGPVALWLDTDRVGSQRAMSTIVLPGSPETRIAWVPHRLRDRETRFIPVDRPAVDRVGAALTAWAQPLDIPTSRIDALVRAAGPGTLASALLGWSMHLIERGLGVSAEPELVSDLLASAPVRRRTRQIIEAIDDVIVVFNEGIRSLAASGIDPAVHPVDAGYLPLNYSCPDDGLRRRLARRGGDAVTTCRCGREFRFSLAALDELFATNRWSADVTLPLLLEPMFSGVVAGKTSWRYGLVLADVTRRVLGDEPLPAYLPPALADNGADEPGLLRLYLEGP